jgi:hypothetical protein
MENNYGNFYYNSYGNNSNEYLTLKHCGALLIREEEPKKNENKYLTLKHSGALLIRNEISNKNKTEEKPSKPAKANKKISFESKVKIFEPKTKKLTNYVPEKEGTKNDKKHMEKPKISNTLLENSNQKNNEDNDVDNINELPRRSAIIQIDDKKNKSSSFFFGLKDNIKKINKSIKDKKQSIVINIKQQKKKIIKMINHKKENEKEIEKEIVLNFKKPKNFEQIEKQWNYAKILIDNNIIDCTSKELFIIYLFFYFYSNL